MKPEEVDHQVVEELARDICYFYHELADYGGISSAVVVGWNFRLPYWDFLDTSGYPGFNQMSPELVAFYREGCMVIVFTMARACIEGDAFEIEAHLNICKALTERMIPEDVRQAQLIDALKRALDMVECDEPDHEELDRLSRLVYRESVQRYFAERAALSHGTEDYEG